MTGTHDNRAVWDGKYVVNECFAESVRDNGWMAIGRRVECEDYAWAQRVNAPDARGLCSALADALGVELHPAGTAAKMQELAKELRREAAENAADKKESLKCIRTLSESISRVRRGRIDYDRVRTEVPECEGLTDGQIDWIANTIRSADILSYGQKASCNKLVRDLTDWNSTAMTARGREVLAAIDACRVTQAEPEPEPEPEPIGYSLRALLGLAWEYVKDARAGSSFLDAARAEGLLVGTYGERKPTDLGRKTWTDFLRRLGLPGDGSQPEPEPEPTLTESADGRREWRLNGVRHREDGPAIEWPDGYREWLLHGNRHREDGPAIELPNGYREWWLHGKLHREDGPAIEWPDGRREWWLHGKLHREDGPAIEWPDGYRSWWLNGVRQPEPDKGGRQ